MKGAGCGKCGDKGYRGRKGVFEIFVVNQEIEEMIYNNVSIVELRRQSQRDGDAFDAQRWVPESSCGITTLDEVLMVTTEEE
jgi:type IV pilus assembly protein PilB